MDKNFEELELRAYENDAEAQYELAVYYKNKQNNKSYVDWLKKSAKLNNSNAKVELAELYLQGVLIDKDEDLAISLLEEELEVNKNARLVLKLRQKIVRFRNLIIVQLSIVLIVEPP
jgi:hypothetical protein